MCYCGEDGDGNKVLTYLIYNTHNFKVKEGKYMQHINELLLDENKMAFHPMMGNSYQLNEVGIEILKLMKEEKNKQQIIDVLHDSYGTSKDDLFIDVSDFMSKLKIYGLTE